MNKKITFLLFGLVGFLTARSQTTVIDSFLYDGVYRNYRLYLPAGFSSSTSRPLVFNLHGYTSNAIEQEAYSGFDNIADTAHIAVCYPNGLNNSWNSFGTSVDDVGYIDTLITIFHSQYNINLNRVYSTGMSNGGFMSNLLGCTLAHRFAAIAPVAGTNVTAIQNSCLPSRRVPVLYIHGTADGIVAYNGSTGVASASDLMELWSNINGCSAVTDTFLLPDISTTDGCRAERITWHNCDSNKQVIHYRIIDGGHTWPGSPFTIGVTNHDFVASKVIWDFFNQFSLSIGIEDPTFDQQIIASPNPFLSNLKIDLPSQAKGTLKLYSTDGKLIKSVSFNDKTIILNEPRLPKGVYYLKIVTDSYSKSVKLIKAGN